MSKKKKSDTEVCQDTIGLEHLPPCPPGPNSPPMAPEEEEDFFYRLLGELREGYASCYANAQMKKKGRKAAYFKGRMDTIAECMKHYKELA